MAKTAGKWSAIYFAGYDLSGWLNQWDFTLEYIEDDVTGFLHGVENSIPDIPRGDASLSAFFDADTDRSHDALGSPGAMTTDVLMILIGEGAAPTIDDAALCMECRQFTYNVTGQAKAAVAAQATFKGADNQPDLALCLANTTITDTTTFDSVNGGAATLDGGAAYLQVLTPTDTDSYAVKVQHSTDDNTYADKGTFTADGTARTSERLALSGTINQYTRAVATRTGAAGDDFELAVAIARH